MKPRIVPGIHSVAEALNARPAQIQEIIFREGELKGALEELFDLSKQRRIPTKRLSVQSMDRQFGMSQGVVAYVSGRPNWEKAYFVGKKSVLIYALDSLEDPHNLGSILRTSWTLGADGILYPKDRSVGLTPAVEKVASGAVEHIPMLEVSNLVQALKDLKEQGFWIYGLSEKAPKTITQVEFSQKTVLVVGSESSGIRSNVLDACDETVRIPQADGAHNLNAAIAASIAGYEVLRQRSAIQKN